MGKKTEMFGEEKTKKTPTLTKTETKTVSANGGEAPALKKRGRKPGSTNKKTGFGLPVKKGWVMIQVPAELAYSIGVQIGSQQHA